MHARLATLKPRLVKQMMGYIDQAVPDLQALPRREREADLRQAVEENLAHLTRMLRDRRPPGHAELAGIAGPVARRVRQGVPLHVTLHAGQVALRGAWALLIQDSEPSDLDHVLAATALFMQLQENVITAACLAYEEELAKAGHAESANHQALVAALMAGEPPEKVAHRTRVRLADQYHVLEFRLRQGAASERRSTVLKGLISAELRAFKDALFTITDAGGTVLVPVFDVGIPSLSDRGRFERLVRRLSDTTDVPVTGAAALWCSRGAVRAAREQLQEVLHIVHALDRGTGVYELSDVMFEYQVTRPGAENDALRRLLGPLRWASDSRLLTTLQAYFRCGFDQQATAVRLNVPTGVVAGRLKRIARLIERDPTRPDDLNEIGAALIACRVHAATHPGLNHHP
jgi:hypothetical protein